jgi:hypothetical protein
MADSRIGQKMNSFPPVKSLVTSFGLWQRDRGGLAITLML